MDIPTEESCVVSSVTIARRADPSGKINSCGQDIRLCAGGLAPRIRRLSDRPCRWTIGQSATGLSLLSPQPLNPEQLEIRIRYRMD